MQDFGDLNMGEAMTLTFIKALLSFAFKGNGNAENSIIKPKTTPNR